MLKQILKKHFSINNIDTFLHNNNFWLPFWLLFGAILCSFTKFDFLWDFENYHLYNPWMLMDVADNEIITPLASINSFFNPLIDLPLYLMIKYLNEYPSIIYALQGLWFGALLFAFHKTALLFFETKTYRNILLFALAIAIAMTGQSTWFQAGASTNEVPIAFMIVFSSYFVLKWQKSPSLQTASGFFWVGILMGLALGLKQTSLTYSFALGITMIIFYKHLNKPYQFICAYILGGFLGCLIIYGPCMYTNYVEYGNPILPFMNTLFKSEYFDDANFHDRRYMPDFKEILYYPYLWEQRSAEIPFEDKRGALFYTISWIFAIYAIVYYIKKRRCTPFLNSYLIRFTITYLFISYIIWSFFFSIFRYLIPLEMMFAIFIMKTVDRLLLHYRGRLILLVQIVCIQALAYQMFKVPFLLPWNDMRELRQERYIDAEKINLPPNTLVKLYNLPSGIIAPIIAKDNPPFKAVIYVDEAYGLHTDFTERGKFGELRDKIVATHQGPTVLFGVGYLTGEVLEKNEFIHSTKYSQLSDLDVIDKRIEKIRLREYKREQKRRLKNMGTRSVDDNTVSTLAGYSTLKDCKYIPSNAEISKMYCRTFYINADIPYFICVPNELKDEILDPATEEKIQKRQEERMKKFQELRVKENKKRNKHLKKRATLVN